MISILLRSSFEFAANCVKDRSEEINKLNVFPVPDGDTGTNMSLTLASVVGELKDLPQSANLQELCQAVIHGSLMGARGNSGVITSQILRGLAEGFSELDGELNTKKLASIFRRSVKVSFQAVRKPVEGTILTVIKDCSLKLDQLDKAMAPLDYALDELVKEAFASVSRTPDYLPVLKENGVVDAGGYGLAIFIEGFVNAATGRAETPSYVQNHMAEDRVKIELNDDWEGSEFTYCTEFLFKAYGLNVSETQDFLASMGDCELLVGAEPDYKVHVHTDTPDRVLKYMLERGQIFEVHIHNMDLQAHERTQKLAEEEAHKAQEEVLEHKELGFVAVTSGDGNEEILKSLGVDKVVRGGQTMNPSTKDLLEAIESVNADKVIVLPNNKNIIMAAQSAAGASSKEVEVIPTKTIAQAFSAMFAFDSTLDLESNAESMTEALEEVHDAEITTAIKNSSAEDGSPIKEGDIIGILDGKIEVVGSSLSEVAFASIEKLLEHSDAFTLTALAGEDLSQADFDKLIEELEEKFDDLEIDAHRGGQPLYPLLLSLE